MRASFTTISHLRSCLTRGALLAVGLLLGSVTPRAWGQFGGTFVSASPQTPITLGQPLNITVIVRNNTGDDWVAGELDASWLTEVDEPSWLPGAPPIDFFTRTTVPDGVTASMVVTLDAAELPGSPGSYSVRLYTAFNFLDVDFLLMTGGPKTVNFTINAAATNHPPAFTPMGDKAVVVTNLLSFKVSATDTDLPSQTLTFNLEPAAPADASIDSSSGDFTWTPAEGPTPRTNQISVRVTDDGSPPLSATNSFQVIVLAPPRIDHISRPTNGVVTLVWTAFPGKTYRVGYKELLEPGPWTYLSPDIQAQGPVVSTTNSVGTAQQRFYLLSILD